MIDRETPRRRMQSGRPALLHAALVTSLAALAAACSDAKGGSATTSNIEHLVVLIQENISFDAYLGTYCEAPTGSEPSCNAGPACCERGPATDPGTGAEPFLLDDAQHGRF